MTLSVIGLRWGRADGVDGQLDNDAVDIDVSGNGLSKLLMLVRLLLNLLNLMLNNI